MTDPEPSLDSSLQQEILLAVRARLLADLEAGHLRRLADYLREAPPSHAEILARVYLEVSGALPPARTGAGSSDHASPDDETFGPYRPIAELGRGGQATVHLAEDARLGRRVALKLLRGLGPASDELMARFQREAAVTARLDHPGICAVYDAGTRGSTGWIAMQYVEGETLAAKLGQARSEPEPDLSTVAVRGADAVASAPSAGEGAGPRTPTDRRRILEVMKLVEDTARTLHLAHEAGIVHRDVKPGNVMVTPDGLPVLLDFGLASTAAGDLPSLTLTGDVLGTPAYMSPEQIGGRPKGIDHRTDVWSLGVVLFECLTLTRPFDAATREGLYRAILTQEVPDVRSLNRAVPADVKVILETALAKDRDHRYQTALDLAEDLRRAACHEPIRARSLSAATRLLRWTRRNPLAASAMALAAVLLVVGTLYIGAVVREGRRLRAAALERRLALASQEADEGLRLGDPLRVSRARDALASLCDDHPESADAWWERVACELRRSGEPLLPLRPEHVQPDRGALLDLFDAMPEDVAGDAGITLLRDCVVAARQSDRGGFESVARRPAPDFPSPAAATRFARSKVLLGRMDEAIGTLLDLVQDHPGSFDAHFTLAALTRTSSGNRKRSLLALESAAAARAQRPDHPRVEGILAMCRFSAAQNEEDRDGMLRAVEWFRRRHAERPEDDALAVDLSYVLNEAKPEGWRGESEKVLRAVLRRRDLPHARWNLVNILLDGEDRTDADVDEVRRLLDVPAMRDHYGHGTDYWEKLCFACWKGRGLPGAADAIACLEEARGRVSPDMIPWVGMRLASYHADFVLDDAAAAPEKERHRIAGLEEAAAAIDALHPGIDDLKPIARALSILEDEALRERFLDKVRPWWRAGERFNAWTEEWLAGPLGKRDL